jgi:hypothetical protein
VESTHEMIPGETVRANLTITMEIMHLSSGQAQRVKRTAFAEPHKGTPLDKAMLGAETSALGYWLRGLLMAPRLELDEVSARNDRDYDPTAIGKAWVDQWLKPTCERLEVPLDMIAEASGMPVRMVRFDNRQEVESYGLREPVGSASEGEG